MRRILVLRALGLGDLLVAVPALRALRLAAPGAEITLVGLPWAREFVSRFRYLDQFLPFPGMDGPALDAFLSQVSAHGYDTLVQMHGDGRPVAELIRRLEVPFKAGLCGGEVCHVLDLPVPYRSGQHEVLRLLAVVEALGLPSQERDLEFPVTEQDRVELSTVLGGRPVVRPLVVVHPGGRTPGRRWGAPGFARLIRRLQGHTGGTFVLVGASDDREAVEAVRSAAGPGIVDLACRTSLGALAALIGDADLFVGNDSGPAHLATALGTPSVVIFTRCMVPEWAPLDISVHRPVYSDAPCPECRTYSERPHRCLQAIGPDLVLAVALELLGRVQGSRDSGAGAAGPSRDTIQGVGGHHKGGA